MNDVLAQELIVCRLATKGKGVQGSPLRRLTQIYSKDGQLVAENDPLGGYTIEDLADLTTHLSQPGHHTLQEWLESRGKAIPMPS